MRAPGIAAIVLIAASGLDVNIAGLGPAAAGAQAPAGEPVHLDVIVTDASGRPVSKLTASDFEVVDAGHVRPIDHVRAPIKTGRVLAIFLDEYHVQAGDATERTRASLTRFVQSQVRDEDVLAVMKPLDPLTSITLTQDRSDVLRTIAAFEGRKGDYVPRSSFEEKFMSRDPRTGAMSRAQVVTSALQKLATRLGETGRGRKSLLLASEGFASPLPRSVAHAANRNGVSIYSIDPHPDRSDHESILQRLADETGGQASLNEADPARVLIRASADLDAYYLLTYQPGTEPDGKFHTVTVRVKRTGVVARVRAGYWSMNPPAPLTAETPRFLRPSRPSHASPYIRPWIGMSRGSAGRTQVTVTWEPGTPVARNQRVASVTLKATGGDGQELFHKRVAAGAATRAAFETAPGYIWLEIGIHNTAGTLVDTDYRGVSVPNLNVSRPTFATPQLMRTRTARGFAAISTDADATPVASRTFSRTERLIVRVPAYTAGDTPPVVTAKLLNRRGIAMRDLEQVPADLPDGMVQFDLPLASLAPDEYQVELTAINAEGVRDEARELVMLSVTH